MVSGEIIEVELRIFIHSSRAFREKSEDEHCFQDLFHRCFDRCPFHVKRMQGNKGKSEFVFFYMYIVFK